MDVVLLISINKIYDDCTDSLNKICTLANIIRNIDNRNSLILINNLNHLLVDDNCEYILRNLKKNELVKDLSYFLLLNNKNIFRRENMKLFIISLGDEYFSDLLFNLKTIIEEENIFIRCFSNYEEKNGLSILGEIKKILTENFLLALSEENKLNDSLFFCPVKCYCHKKIIKIGFICPVCLSVFCKKVGICMMCKTRIAIN